MFFIAAHTFAQNRAIDSLRDELNKKENNETRFRYLFENALYYVGKKSDSAFYFGSLLFRSAKKLDGNKEWADYFHFKTLWYSNHMKYDSALLSALSGLDYSFKSEDEQKIGYAFNQVGNINIQIGQADSAVLYLLKGLPYAERAANKRLPVNMRYNLSAAYYQIGNARLALQYAKDAYGKALKLNDSHLLYNSLFNWATMEVAADRLDTALIMFEQLKDTAKKNNDDYNVMDVLNNTGDIYYRKGAFKKSLEQYNMIASILKNYDEPEYDLYLYMNRGNTLIPLNRFEEAETDLIKATNLAKRLHARMELTNIYQFRSNLYEKKNDFKSALYYWKLADSLKQESIKEDSRKNIQSLEIKYQTANKELQLAKKETALKNKNTLNAALIVGCIVLGLILFLAYRNIRQRHKNLITERKLHKQRIKELERQHQLEAMQSIMRGQEAERSRLAKDLHDGIGGLLSGVKLGLSSVQKNEKMQEQNTRTIDAVINQLDKSISELRRVSHNMMPEALLKYGLKEALQNYCENLNLSGNVHVKLQTYGLSRRLEQGTEIVIYRIVQELLNNIIKHAEAKNALVQLSCEAEGFSLTVEDDGKGFDVNEINEIEGAGIANIKARATYLQATVDVQSTKGEGTSVMISGKLPPEI